MPSLVAFDLDGTLIDSQLDLAESANEMLAGYGARPLSVSELAAMVGDGARQLVDRALQAAGVVTDLSAALDQFLSIYGGRLTVHTRPYPGIRAVVAAASTRAALAVLTNKPEGLSHRVLKAFDMDRYFGWVIGGDSPFGRKPDPAGLRHLIEVTGASPEKTLLVGDSAADVETARRVGARVCVAHYGFGHLRRPITLEPRDLVATRPEDVAGRIDEFLAQAGS